MLAFTAVALFTESDPTAWRQSVLTAGFAGGVNQVALVELVIGHSFIIAKPEALLDVKPIVTPEVVNI